jgi:hypothetical protein
MPEGTAARKILDHAYGRVPEAAAEPLLPIIQGIGMEPFHTLKEKEQAVKGPSRLEDFPRSLWNGFDSAP